MEPRLETNTLVSQYRIAELVGEDASHIVYLTIGTESVECFWLIQEIAPFEGVPIPKESRRFQFENQTYTAFRVDGTPLTQLLALVRTLDWRFIARRWEELARNIGYEQALNKVYSARQPLALESFVFTASGQLTIVPYDKGQRNIMPFPAPETATQPPTALSDVYSLGAILRALVEVDESETLASLPSPIPPVPRELNYVLSKATSPAPDERYKSALALASALTDVLPRRPPIDLPPPRKRLSTTTILIAAGIVIFLCVLIAGIAWEQVRPRLTDNMNFAFSLVQSDQTRTAPAPIEVADVTFGFSPQCNGEFRFRLKQDGSALPPELAKQFTVYLNDQPVEVPAQDMSCDGATGICSARFQGGDFCLRPGKLRAVVRMERGEGVYNGAYSVQEISPLQDARGSVQVNTSGYPKMLAYFSVSKSSGEAMRLGGRVRANVRQDGIPIGTFDIEAVNPETDPLTAALVIDVSGSMKGEPLSDARFAAVDFIRRAFPNDVFCIYSFSSQVKQVQDCTLDHGAAGNAILVLQAEGATTLYDALVAVANDQLKLTGRRAILVLSDGEDTDSKATLPEALENLKQTNIPVYTIGLVGNGFNDTVLEQLATANGGLYFKAPRSNELAGLYQHIQDQLGNQYVLKFNSAFPERKQGQIEIQLSDGDESLNIDREFVVQPSR